MSIVERQADTIQPETFEELGILLLEEILQELGKRATLTKPREQWLGPQTLSKKNADFSGPITPARAARIWNSHPG